MADFAHMKIHRSQDRPSGWTVAKSKISFHTLVIVIVHIMVHIMVHIAAWGR